MIVKSIFKKFDTDHSGSVTVSEFRAACYELGYSLSKGNALNLDESSVNHTSSTHTAVEQAAVAFKHVDTDSTGLISQDEFLVYIPL